MRGVLARAERMATPTRAEALAKDRVAGRVMELVGRQAARHPEIAAVEFGGSYPKGTWLPQRADIDVFLKFAERTGRARFEAVARRVGFAALRGHGPYTRYSEHPYVEASVGGTRVNVVPCYAVRRGGWKSAADRSPYHTEFMIENLTGPMKAGARMLKLFLRSSGAYGAEISTQGFSGYAAEVLVWGFGGFEGAVRGLAGASRGQVIGRADREFGTPISLMDPVDPGRNLAAAVSAENVGRVALLCRAFLAAPSASYFGPRRLRASAAALRECAVASFACGPRSPEVAWGQAKSAAAAVAAQLGLAGFSVLRHDAHVEGGRASLLFLLESAALPAHVARAGPDVFSAADAARFVSKNAAASRAMWVGADGRIRSLQRRPERDARRFLRRLLTEGLAGSGVPGGMMADVRRGVRVSGCGAAASKSVKARLREMASVDAAAFPPG